MEINTQPFYKAPKLNSKNISRNVFSGSSSTLLKPTKVQLKVKPFSFKKPDPILKKDIEPTDNLAGKLAETNQVLVEIQKQLSIDFASRIAQENAEVKKIRSSREKEKIAAEENRLEKTGEKIRSIGSSLVSKVAAPVKSIFDRIKEFFGLILTNIVLNKAFEWLKDENNAALVNTIFDWIGKAFIPAVITIIGYKVFKWVRRLYKLGKLLLGIPYKIFNRLFRGGAKIPRTGGAENASRKTVTSAAQKASEKKVKSELAEKVVSKGLSSAGKIAFDPATGTRRFISVSAEEATKITAKPNVFQKMMSKASGIGNSINNQLSKRIIQPIVDISLSKKVPAPVRAKVGKAVASKGIQRFLPFVNTIFSTGEAVSRLMSGDIEGALISMAGAIPIAGWGAIALDIYRTVDPEGYQKNIRFGLSAEQMDGLIVEGFAAVGENMGGIGLSKGGTVPGEGPGTVDSVRTNLAPGEEVIKTSSSMLFRPLLKDINDNAGRQYSSFSRGVESLKTNSNYQRDVSEEYSKVLEDFNKSLKNSIDSKRIKKTSTNTFPPPPILPPSPTETTTRSASEPNIMSDGSVIKPGDEVGGSDMKLIQPPTPKTDDKDILPKSTPISPSMATPPNLNLDSSTKSKISIIDLPIQKMGGDIQQMPSMQKTATDVEVITPVNFLNPYMTITPEIYGIYM